MLFQSAAIGEKKGVTQVTQENLSVSPCQHQNNGIFMSYLPSENTYCLAVWSTTR